MKKLLCSKCGQYEVEVDEEVTAVICPMCCVKMGPAITPKTPQETQGPRRPKGWRFMKVFVDSEGNVFHKGEEQPDLKGTLGPTKVVKKSKFQREQEKADKEKRLAERYEKKQAKIKAAEEKANETVPDPV
jgi:hypothetical protein